LEKPLFAPEAPRGLIRRFMVLQMSNKQRSKADAY